MMVCAMVMRVWVKSQIVRAMTELGRILMSKSSLTAKLRTSTSQAADTTKRTKQTGSKGKNRGRVQSVISTMQ